MKTLISFRISVMSCLLASLLVAQVGVVSPMTPHEIDFFRFLLMTVGSIDYDPQAIGSYERAARQMFGLNDDEAALIHSAAQQMRSVLSEIRFSSKSLMGKPALSSQDQQLVSALSAKREQAICSLASSILSSVRPQTAERFRAAARAGHSKTAWEVTH